MNLASNNRHHAVVCTLEKLCLNLYQVFCVDLLLVVIHFIKIMISQLFIIIIIINFVVIFGLRSIYFVGNSASESSVGVIHLLDLCSWINNSVPFFNASKVLKWDFVKIK